MYINKPGSESESCRQAECAADPGPDLEFGNWVLPLKFSAPSGYHHMRNSTVKMVLKLTCQVDYLPDYI